MFTKEYELYHRHDLGIITPLVLTHIRSAGDYASQQIDCSDPGAKAWKILHDGESVATLKTNLKDGTMVLRVRKSRPYNSSRFQVLSEAVEGAIGEFGEEIKKAPPSSQQSIAL